MARLKRYILRFPLGLRLAAGRFRGPRTGPCRSREFPNEVFVDLSLRRTRSFAGACGQLQGSVRGEAAPAATTVWRPSSAESIPGKSERAWAPRLSSRESA